MSDPVPEGKGETMKIIFYHTLYKRDVEYMVFGNIEFHYEDHAYVTFKSGGHGYMVDAKYIKRIEPIED